MICYPVLRAKGWQLSSGPTEAMCKMLMARLKGKGRPWDGDAADAIMAVDALSQNGQSSFPSLGC
jgi:hypothetical protein